MTIRNDMFSEIQIGLIGSGNESFLQSFPVKYVDSHRGQVASGILGFFFKVCYLAVFVRDDNTKALRFVDRYRHYRNRALCAVLLMEIKHYLIIHFINMIP